jgi:hypothetical protein
MTARAWRPTARPASTCWDATQAPGALRQPRDEWALGWVGASGPPHPRHDPAAKAVLDRTQKSSANTRRQLDVLGPSRAAIAVGVLGR